MSKIDTNKERAHSQAVDNYLLNVRGGYIDPLVHPKWKISDCISYLCWFPISFSMTLFMCIVGFFLAGYGWYSLNKNTPKTKHKHSGLITKKGNKKALISIIIPCLNEKYNIFQCLLFLEKYCSDKQNCEIILIDGGSTDGWVEQFNDIENNEIHSNNLLTIPCKILEYSQHKKTGRGTCQNIGVQHANGDIYLFMHADCVLVYGFDEIIRNKLDDSNGDNDILIGSFKFNVDRSLLTEPVVGLGCMELFANIRCYMFWLPYGDQTYFLTKDKYQKYGLAFENVVITEDINLTSKARKIAVENGMKIYVGNSKENCYCSPRRWQKNGVAKNTMWNQIVVFLWKYRGYTPDDIYKLYYGVDPPKLK